MLYRLKFVHLDSVWHGISRAKRVPVVTIDKNSFSYSLTFLTFPLIFCKTVVTIGFSGVRLTRHDLETFVRI